MASLIKKIVKMIWFNLAVIVFALWKKMDKNLTPIKFSFVRLEDSI